jgi:hypothetical protein
MLLLVEMNNLHNIFRLNVEATSEAMWLYRILRKSKVFVNNCKEAFSKDNPLQLKLGDNVFCAFATYVVSVYAVLEKKGLKLNEGWYVPSLSNANEILIGTTAPSHWDLTNPCSRLSRN